MPGRVLGLPTYLSGWLASARGGALLRATEIDWQNALTGAQDLLDLQNFLRTATGSDLIKSVALRDTDLVVETIRNGVAVETVLSLDYFGQGAEDVVDENGRLWSGTRRAFTFYGPSDTAEVAGIFRDGNSPIEIMTRDGFVNGNNHGGVPLPNRTWWRACGHQNFWVWASDDNAQGYISVRNRSSAALAVADQAMAAGWQIRGVAMGAGRRLHTLLVDIAGGRVAIQETLLSIDGAISSSPESPAVLIWPSTIPVDNIVGCFFYNEEIFIMAVVTNSRGVTKLNCYPYTLQLTINIPDILTFDPIDGVVSGFISEDGEEQYILTEEFVFEYLQLRQYFTSLTDTPALITRDLPVIGNDIGSDLIFSRIGAEQLGEDFTVNTHETPQLLHNDGTLISISNSVYYTQFVWIMLLISHRPTSDQVEYAAPIFIHRDHLEARTELESGDTIMTSGLYKSNKILQQAVLLKNVVIDLGIGLRNNHVMVGHRAEVRDGPLEWIADDTINDMPTSNFFKTDIQAPDNTVAPSMLGISVGANATDSGAYTSDIIYPFRWSRFTSGLLSLTLNPEGTHSLVGRSNSNSLVFPAVIPRGTSDPTHLFLGKTSDYHLMVNCARSGEDLRPLTLYASPGQKQLYVESWAYGRRNE